MITIATDEEPTKLIVGKTKSPEFSDFYSKLPNINLKISCIAMRTIQYAKCYLQKFIEMAYT